MYSWAFPCVRAGRTRPPLLRARCPATPACGIDLTFRRFAALSRLRQSVRALEPLPSEYNIVEDRTLAYKVVAMLVAIRLESRPEHSGFGSASTVSFCDRQNRSSVLPAAIAPHVRTILAPHVTLQLVDRRRLRSSHDCAHTV